MIPKELLDFLRSKDSFLIIGHQEPDADCIGSQLALGSFLKRLGKQVRQCNQGPFKRPEINSYQPLFSPRVDPFDKVSSPGVVVVDCSTIDRIGELQADIEGLDAAVIDHHSAGQSFGTVRWVEGQRACCTEMIHELMLALGGTPTPEEAHWLFLGLATDTGFFRHLEASASATFRTAAALADSGASAKAVYQQLNGGKVLANQRLMGLVLSRTQAFFNGRMVFSWEELGDRTQLGAESRESDQIYQTLQGVVGVEIIVLLRQETATTVTGGLRSRALIDVGALAQSLGGGGHVRASGFSCTGTVAEVKARILELVEPAFADKSQ